MSRYILTDEDYEKLLAFRTGLRRFLRWSEQRAEQLGITPAQHQLLLAIKGHRHKYGPTIGELADYLLLQHHSVGGLVQRALEAGLVQRFEDPGDRRVSRVRLTNKGEAALAELSTMHLAELSRLAEEMSGLWEGLNFPSNLHHGKVIDREET